MADKSNSEICLLTLVFLLVIQCASAVGKTIYVDDDAVGANDGSSWENAYKYLQDALADANSAPKPVEIRVAQGIYRPNQGILAIPDFDWRTVTFQLISGVSLKGGYAGAGCADPNAHDIKLYETVLSGDLNGDDVEVSDPCDLLGEPTRSENSYHVVTGSGADATAVLDGFTITGGCAVDFAVYGRPPSNLSILRGGGMYGILGSPTLTKCTFYANLAALEGGGMYNEQDSNPMLTDCTFNKNSAGPSSGGHGGGMSNSSNSNPILTNCKFSNNWAGQGGGINALCCAPIANSCKFMDNSANFGGGVQYKDSIGPKFFGCTFNGNSAHEGAAARFIKSSPILTNCLFVVNSADSCGGAIAFTNMSTPTLANCAFAANIAAQGCALACEHVFYGPSIVYINNSIFWNGGNEIWNNDCSMIDITYCDIKSGNQSIFDPNECIIWGGGNVDVDPLFADPNNGDYHLKSEAGRWDPNSQSWVRDDVTSPCIDAGDPNSDWAEELWPHGERINMGAYGGTQEASMSPSIVYIQWLGHSSVKVWTEDCVVYVDPRNLSESLHDATLVLVTHPHADHYQPTDIAKVSGPETKFIAPPDVVQQYGKGQPIAPGQTIELDCTSVTAVPAYNTNKPNHPKSRNWVGFIIEIGSKRIYVAGDTDLIPEMYTLGRIDVAFLPVGGTYTMNAVEAAEATEYIKPELAIPYHWGQNVGTLSDAETFAQKAACAVKILTVGETISSDNWPEYSPLIAYWKLDETEGNIAHDSSGNYDGTLYGDPLWQPADGRVDGALGFDGTDDYVSTGSVLDPADGAFSIFAWIKGGAPGQVILSQIGEANWLCADPSGGNLMTELEGIGRDGGPLVSQTPVSDGGWHHVGLTWDGSNRILYVDELEVARDTQAQFASSAAGLYIGAGKNLEPGSFFSGLIDDIRIYNQALSPADIEEPAR